MDKQMTVQQALQILHQVSEAFAMNGTDRDRAREASKTISEFIQRHTPRRGAKKESRK